MSDAQIKHTQIVLREVNERIAEITRRQEESDSGFLCECGRDDCLEIFALSLVDYEAMRNGDFFIAAPGHCVEGVNRLVESRDGFDVLAQA